MATTQRRLLFGSGLPGWSAHTLLSPLNLDEWDTALWQLGSASAETNSGQHSRSGYARKVQELFEWVASGHLLIILVDAVMNSNGLSVGDLGLLPSIRFEHKVGRSVGLVGDSATVAPFAPFIDKVQYRYILGGPETVPLLRVVTTHDGPDQLVALLKRHGAGRVIFVPPIQGAATDQIAYYDALSRIPVPQLSSGAPVPSWALGYLTQGEFDAAKSIEADKKQIATLERQIDGATAHIREQSWLKQLFVGTGDALMSAVKRALEELGLKVAKVQGNRTDLFAFYDDQLLVIEVKGLERSSRAENLSQVNRWIADARSALIASAETLADDHHLSQCAKAIAELGVPSEKWATIKCKGCMIINTYRSIPLDDRTDPDFPNDLLQEIRRSDVVALTGLQLLCMVLEARRSSTGVANLEALFETNGTFQVCDWREHLKQPS